jgi:uncharacterized protein
MKALSLLFGVFMLVCSKKEEPMLEASQFEFAYSRLQFTCVHESKSLPELDKYADMLHRYGLYLEKLKGKKNYDEIARYYRIAAAHAHYRSAANLQYLLSSGLASSPDASKETIDLAESYMEKGIPGAFYDMAHYLELGYGVKQDLAASKAYFRRAADLGSPDAQLYISELLTYVPDTIDTVLAMYKCAMEQGNGVAARKYANFQKGSGLYQEALQAYHLAIKNGDLGSASRLASAFMGVSVSNELYYIAVKEDKERVERYKKITHFLRRHEHLGAKIPDLDEIVPLPPAALPEWDGTFKWQRDRDSYVPVIPSQELIEKLSAEKGLDPATGLPLPGVKT